LELSGRDGDHGGVPTDAAPLPTGSPDSPDSPDRALAAGLEALARDVAGAAAEVMADAFRAGHFAIERKSTATDLVTEVDRASERLIVERLRTARPDDAIVGEEGAAVDGSSGIRWVVDPIDGTTNFVYGHPGFSVSIAAELVPGPGRPAVPLAGAVVDPLSGEVFSASAGGGATRNGTPLRCSTQDVLGHALVGTGFAYSAERRAGQAEVLTTVLPRIRDIRRVGSAALDLCGVACGRLDAFYERGLGHWDFAAGVLIAAEAGAVVSVAPAGSVPGAFVVAAAPGIDVPFRALLDEAGADRA
jgi:myo-inositol-1(or 4)-monophosphatase